MKIRCHVGLVFGIALAMSPLAPAQDAGCGCAHHGHHDATAETGGYSVEGCLGGREITQYDSEQLWTGYCEGDCRVGTAKPCHWHGLGCRCRHCAGQAGSGFGYDGCGCGDAGCGDCGSAVGHRGCGLGHHRAARGACGCDCGGTAGGSGFQFSGCCDNAGCGDCGCGGGRIHGVGLHRSWGYKRHDNSWDDMCGQDYWAGSGSPYNGHHK